MRRSLARLAGAAKLAASVVLVVVLIRRVDWETWKLSAHDVDATLVALAFLCFLGIALFEVMRLRVVFAELRPGWLSLWRLHLLGAFFGNFLPGQLGADVYKVVALRREGTGAAQATSLLLVLRLYGLMVLLVGALIAVRVLGTAGASWEFDPSLLRHPGPLWGLALVLLIAVGLLSSRAWRGMILESVCPHVHAAWRAITAIRPGQAMLLVLISGMILVARVLVVSLLIRSVGAHAEPSVVLLTVCAGTLGMLLPISFAGIGVREGLMVVFLTRFTVGYEQAVAVAFLGRLFILALSLAGGLWTLKRTLRSRSPRGDRTNRGSIESEG